MTTSRVRAALACPGVGVGVWVKAPVHVHTVCVWAMCPQPFLLFWGWGWSPRPWHRQMSQAFCCSDSGFFFYGSFWFSSPVPGHFLLLFSPFFFFFTFLILLLPTAFQGPTTFHLNQISSFANSTWAQNQGSGWLGDLQIHGWNSESGTAIFLKPWSKGNLSDEEVTELEEIFRVYLIGFLRVIQDHVSEFQLACECRPLERLSVISLFLLFRHHTPGSFSLSPQFIQLL